MCICTAYLLVSIRNFLARKLPHLSCLVLIPLILAIGVQIRELPWVLTGSVLFRDDTYFVADRAFKEKKHLVEPESEVLAYPLIDFRLYPAFSSMKLKQWGVGQSIEAGQLVLFSTSRVERSLYYARKTGDSRTVESLLHLLERNTQWECLFECKGIVMVRAKSDWQPVNFSPK